MIVKSLYTITLVTIYMQVVSGKSLNSLIGRAFVPKIVDTMNSDYYKLSGKSLAHLFSMT